MLALLSQTCDAPLGLTGWGIQESGAAMGAGYFCLGSRSLRKP